MLVIDATNAICGRLSAYCAKQSLKGEKVIVLNAEKIVISGNPKEITLVYSKRRGIQYKADPEKSAKWPRRPDLLFKRIIRGMLPKHSPRGKAALERIMVYLGEPEHAEAKKPFTNTSDALGKNFISFQQLCKNLGWSPKI